MPGPQHKLNLVLDLIREFCGEVVRDVAEVLILTEAATLAKLGNHFRVKASSSGVCKVQPNHIQYSLLLLWQMRFLQIQTPPSERGDKYSSDEVTMITIDGTVHPEFAVYVLDQDAVLKHLQRGRLILYFQKRYGVIGGLIGVELLKNGRLTKAQIKTQLTEKLASDEVTSLYEQNQIEDDEQEMEAYQEAQARFHTSVTESLDKMIRTRVLVNLIPQPLYSIQSSVNAARLVREHDATIIKPAYPEKGHLKVGWMFKKASQDYTTNHDIMCEGQPPK